MTDNDLKWKHSKTLVDGELFHIEGLNIWDEEWIDTKKKIQINDPIYGKPFTFSIYQIAKGGIKIKFAAGEFSNCVWGIYEEL